MSEDINLRLGYYAFDYGTDLNEEEIEYDLERERTELREELSDARYFPVVSLGASYRF